MTFHRFKEIEEETINAINSVLDKIKEQSFPDYVLLLANAGYQVEHEGTFLSPYCIEVRLEKYQNTTRRKFYVNYINSLFSSSIKIESLMDDENKEFNTCIQVMIYSQLWESLCFLNRLHRVTALL